MNWLDTETKSILQKNHDQKLAPSKAAEFGLVLLRKGTDQERLVRAVCRINECTEAGAVALAHSPAPLTINPGLPSLEQQIVRACELTLSRAPSDRERAQFVAHAWKHGLASACRVLFNSNEFMFRDILAQGRGRVLPHEPWPDNILPCNAS